MLCKNLRYFQVKEIDKEIDDVHGNGQPNDGHQDAVKVALSDCGLGVPECMPQGVLVT